MVATFYVRSERKQKYVLTFIQQIVVLTSGVREEKKGEMDTNWEGRIKTFFVHNQHDLIHIKS